MAVTHAKDVTGPDGTRPNRVQPSDWVDDHDVDLSDYAGAALPEAAIPDLSGTYDAVGSAAAAQAAAEATAAAANTADIATHAGIAAAHHAKYTDGEAVAAVQAEAPLDLPADLTVDTIDESTLAAGVTIEGVKLKDSGIAFTDVTLDDTTLDTGVWTPTLTFATPGDLSVAYTTRTGTYTRVGRLVIIHAVIETSTFTHTTASGSVRITGMPFTAGANSELVGSVSGEGWTLAGVSNLNVKFANGTVMSVYYSRSGLPDGSMTNAHFPTGGTVQLYLTISYYV